MKRPLQLSLAIALALGVTDAFALGLGVIQVQSGLNQPLKAEIPIIQSAPGEAEGLIVQLASAEEFERVGMSRSNIGVPVTFSLGKNARGEPVIKVSSADVVRDPFLGLLIEANWPKGRLLREYTVLLDPPIMAPAVKGSSAVAVAAAEPERTATQTLPASKPPPKSVPKAPMAAPAAPVREPVAKAEAAPKAESTPRAASGSEYGPVASGETLGEIARATRSGEEVSVNQMMLALLKNNPNAFFKDNINALKRGAVLRIPSAEEVKATGSAREAAATVRSQIDEWRGGASSAPTIVADTTPATTTTTPATATRKPASTASSASPGERLALVPPREGKAGQDAADRPSGGRAGDSGDVASKAELARVKEALTSREQESGELKSRVKDLEDIKGKNEKLITLQSTELAELRNKLQEMQEQEKKAAAVPKSPAATAVVTAPAATAPAVPAKPAEIAAKSDTKISKDDIWGDADKPATAVPPAASVTTPSAVATPTPASATVTATPPAAAVTTTPVLAPTPSTSPAPSAEKAADAPVKKVEPRKTDAKKDDVKKDAGKKPVDAKTATTAASPWYLETWALGVAGLAGLLLVVLGIFGLRKRKPVVIAARTVKSDSFAASALGGGAAGGDIMDAEEQDLIDQVQGDPTNAGAHLELLSLYYAQGASEKFEVAAEEMYAYIADPNQPAWREVLAMGEELVPHNQLFSKQAPLADEYAGESSAYKYKFEDPTPAGTTDYPGFGDEDAELQLSESTLATESMPALDLPEFDLGETHPAAPIASADTSFSFDLPPIDEVPKMSKPEFERLQDEPATDVSDDEFFAGEDAIGTKLDLAKAYLDMGDPDGARSMLEEVMAEGSASQQAEARKLISEIG